MAETSRFWDGTTVGDATASPYDAESEFADVLRALFRSTSFDNAGGVVTAGSNALEPTVVGSSVSIDSGYAMVWGTWYHNDAAILTSIPTPSGATRIDRLVLRKDWVAQTVRLTRIAGAEGGGEPSMTQVAGTTWDIPLCSASVTTGGVITLTDERDFSAPPGAALFVPWTGPGPFPTTTITSPNDNTVRIFTLDGLPLNATAALISIKYGSGFDNFLYMGTTASGLTNVWEALSLSAQLPPFIIPISTPGEIAVVSTTSGTLIFDVLLVGWWIPQF